MAPRLGVGVERYGGSGASGIVGAVGRSFGSGGSSEIVLRAPDVGGNRLGIDDSGGAGGSWRTAGSLPSEVGRGKDRRG